MPAFEATDARKMSDSAAWPHGTRRLKPPTPVVVAPLAVSQLNVEAVAGINARRYLNWLASHPEVPRARIGRLAIVEAHVLLAHLGDLAHARTIPAEEASAVPQAADNDQAADSDHDLTADEILARIGRRRLAPGECSTPAGGETWGEWFKRYLPTKECSEGHRRITKSVESKWISPVIGAKPIAKLTRDDIEDVRDKLDRALDAKTIRHSTARNVWSVLTGAMKAAYNARDRSLRVLAGAPNYFDMLPPKRGGSRQRPWLYPREWSALASSRAVPLPFMHAIAVALYTGLRPSELVALTWGDVDIEARTISISKAFDAETRTVKAPKTGAGQRIIPILEPLFPLLKSLAGDDDAPVLGAFKMSEDHVAPTFRAYLSEAGIERPRLTADSETEEPIDFRSLRDTHATWLALAGVDAKKIQRRLGHKDANTTDRYIKVAESFASEYVGAPFPPLPIAEWSGDWPKDWPTSKRRTRVSAGNSIARLR